MEKRANSINNGVSFIRTLIELTRPFNVLMVGAGVVIAILVGIGSIAPLYITIPAVLSAMLIAAGGNSLNDYYDRYIDNINRPGRPIPSGKITSLSVWTYAIVLFAVGILTSFYLIWICVIIAIVNSLLLVGYASNLKKSGFFGNILISYLVASVFAFGAAAIGNLFIGVFLAICAFFTNAAREVLKDIEDIKGDEMFGAETLPTVKGKKMSLIVVISFLITTILVSPLPYFLNILSFYYLILAFVADGIFVYVIYLILKKPVKKNITLSQKTVKIGAIIGLLAFLAGAIPI